MDYPCIMHLFLTGEKQVGKSTLVRTLLNNTARPVKGLRSVSIFENGDRVVYLFPATETEATEENGRKAGVCRNHHVVEKHPEVFNTYGVSLLSGIPSGSLVVIDEVGNMEREAALYDKAVLSLLDRDDILVFGVVQKMASTPLSEAIRSHRNVHLTEVTMENRDLLVETLKGALL